MMSIIFIGVVVVFGLVISFLIAGYYLLKQEHDYNIKGKNLTREEIKNANRNVQ